MLPRNHVSCVPAPVQAAIPRSDRLHECQGGCVRVIGYGDAWNRLNHQGGYAPVVSWGTLFRMMKEFSVKNQEGR